MNGWTLAQSVTIPSITINLSMVVTWVIIGLIAGILAGILVRGRRYSSLTSLIVGLVGALLGGLLFTVLIAAGLQVSPALLDGPRLRWIDLIVAFVGAILVYLLAGLFYGFRRRL